jgi:hypothetical protein
MHFKLGILGSSSLGILGKQDALSAGPDLARSAFSLPPQVFFFVSVLFLARICKGIEKKNHERCGEDPATSLTPAHLQMRSIFVCKVSENLQWVKS